MATRHDRVHAPVANAEDEERRRASETSRIVMTMSAPEERKRCQRHRENGREQREHAVQAVDATSAGSKGTPASIKPSPAGRGRDGSRPRSPTSSRSERPRLEARRAKEQSVTTSTERSAASFPVSSTVPPSATSLGSGSLEAPGPARRPPDRLHAVVARRGQAQTTCSRTTRRARAGRSRRLPEQSDHRAPAGMRTGTETEDSVPMSTCVFPDLPPTRNLVGRGDRMSNRNR